ncbi:MAG: amidase, partial [Fulvivirga sp.]|nr:amidase [Fulvivirga sp.]
MTVAQKKERTQSIDSLAIVEHYFNLNFTQAERDSMRESINRNLRRIRTIHQYKLENETPMSLVFDPRPNGFEMKTGQSQVNWSIPTAVKMPADINDLAFYTVAELSVLIRSKQISSQALTRFFIDRLKKYGDTLQCVVTLTETLAMQQAKKADEELARGIYRGPLHGIPYGIKDLFAVEGYPTTWGAMPYKDQQLKGSATVVKQLEAAGAVLVAKLTLGALAMGDIWYGGITKNPWNMKQGSSGSSAGSAAAIAAGLVPFAIGTETWGSIVSPSTRCGVTGLRPTFGQVSRHGGMALSWTMDKVGPMARSAQDCAIIFHAIRGQDGLDQSVVETSFNYDHQNDPTQYKVGYLKDLFERDYSNRANDSITLQKFRELGVAMDAISLPDDIPIRALSILLSAEAAAAFDLLTRSNQDSLLVNQRKGAWPDSFRTARFISAVDYINANRIREHLIESLNHIIKHYDVILTPSFGGSQLLMTNLTGHPCVVFPNGF